MSRKLCKQYSSRVLALLLVALLLVSAAPAVSAAEGGSCGSKLTWSLDGSTLTISGSGAMEDYAADHMPPWYGLRESITQISLPEGLTHIGDVAFYDCQNLKSAAIPGSVRSIGALAFSNCSAMTMVTFRDGLKTISDNAFEKCKSLLDLRLPASLTYIGHHAFYFSTSLASVSCPGSMITFGSGIFSYCESLVHAEFGVSADALPGWTFYGCDLLTTVKTDEGSISAASKKVSNSGGSRSQAPAEREPAPELPESIQQSVNGNTTREPTPELPESIQQNVNGNTTVTTQTTTTSDGETVSSTTVKTTGDSTTVSTTTTTRTDEKTTVRKDVTSTVMTPEGWSEVVRQLEKTPAEQSSRNTDETVTATVYYAEGNIVPKEVLQELVGKEVTLTIQTQSGSLFTIDCGKLPEKIKNDLNLSYTIQPLEDVPEGMEGCTVYQLKFEQSADIQVEMIIPLPGNHGFQTASLYRMEKGKPIQLQSVLVDAEGKAHWYLRSIDHKQEYLIGINIPGATTDAPIIPAELAGVYKVANVYDGVEYVVTGRTSSWNMGLGRVMIILAVVMISAIAVIGFVMYAMNKRRLKNGYVPQWEDEDEV